MMDDRSVGRSRTCRTPIGGAIGDHNDRRRWWATAPSVVPGPAELRSAERSATITIGDDGGRPLRRSFPDLQKLRSAERSATTMTGDDGIGNHGYGIVPGELPRGGALSDSFSLPYRLDGP